VRHEVIETVGSTDVTRSRDLARWIACAIAAVGLGAYAGVHLLIPLAASALAWWAGARIGPGSRRAVMPAAAVQAGHLLWLLFGQVVGRGLDRGVVDLVVLALGVGWLIARPGLAPILLLTAYQLWALATNGALFIAARPGTLAHRALLVHVVWRLLALALLWRGHARLRREWATPPAPTRPS
jgi:hypothetical protein